MPQQEQKIKDYESKLISRIKRSASVESFRFEEKERIDFRPGQFLQLVFDPQERSNKNLNKYLSFSCSPTKDYIEVTKKISQSEFSERLRQLKPGDSVIVKASMGRCVLDENAQKVGFIIGGIGITPVISMLEYIVEKNLTVDVKLLYSNWRKEEIAFFEELEDWKNKQSNIEVVHTLVECPDEDGICFSGKIDKVFIKNQMSDFCDRVIYLFGPPAMVKAMQDNCQAIGCKDQQIKTESFLGY